MLFEMVSAYNVLLLLMSMVHALRIMSIAHEGLTNIHEAEFVNCYAQNFKATTKEQGDIIDNLMYLKSTYIRRKYFYIEKSYVCIYSATYKMFCASRYQGIPYNFSS